MKTILVATDFSKAAHNATLYGLQLAKAFNARLILFHAYQLPLNSPDWPVIVNKEDLILQTEAEFKEELITLGDTGNTIVETMHEEGPNYQTILSVAAKLEAEVIVAGMKKLSRRTLKIFGSTVTALKKETQTPLLVVPEDAAFVLPRTIALASNADLKSGVAFLEILKEMVEKLKAKFYVTHIVKRPADETYEMVYYIHRLNRLLADADPVYEYPEDKDVSHGLKQFIAEKNVDMLAMIAYDHTLFERLFVKSNINEMILESPVPLLILPDTSSQYESLEIKGSTSFSSMPPRELFSIY
jgi:nucleotide-binding universal stress UspA family protein